MVFLSVVMRYCEESSVTLSLGWKLGYRHQGKEAGGSTQGNTCSQVVKTSSLSSIWTRITFKYYPCRGSLTSKLPQPCLWNSLNPGKCVNVCIMFGGYPDWFVLSLPKSVVCLVQRSTDCQGKGGNTNTC